MSNRFYLTIWSSILTSLFSCQRSELFDRIDHETDNTIGFALYDSLISTRGTARQGDGLAVYNTDKVHVFVYSYDESKSWASIAPGDFSMYFRSKLNNDLANAKWGYAPDEPQTRFYPQSKRLACFAYASDLAPITGANTNENGLSITDPTAGVPTVTYTVPTDVVKQPDLILSERITDRNAGAITLPMKHALTRIGILMLGVGQKISDVSITGVASQGSVSLDVDGEINWDLKKATYDETYGFGLIRSAIVLSEEAFNPLRNDGYLMMLPQPMTDNVKLEFKLNDTPVSVSLCSPDFPDWEPGKKITYLVDVSNDKPAISIDFGGNVLSNCYIINPSPTSKQELKIPITRVNQFWGKANDYDTSNNGDANRINNNEEWTVSILWYDAFDLVGLPGGNSVQLGKATGRGGNDYFSVIVPAGFQLKGNLVVGIAKGSKGPVLVHGGTTDREGNLESGAVAKCLWSWHIWVTDYNPYPENWTTTDTPSGKYAEVPNGILWQGVSASFDQIKPSIRDTMGILLSTGNQVWDLNKRMLMDRPIGVRSRAFMCENRSNYIGTTVRAEGYESGVSVKEQTRLNGNGILYYQFGRKDPFPTDITLYTMTGDAVNQAVTYSETANGQLAPVPVWYTVHNPLRMIHTGTGVDPNNGGGNWASDPYARSDEGAEDILWADPRTVKNPTAKSIFDPSPWLFRAPRTGAYNSFVTNYSYHAGSTSVRNPNNSPDLDMVRNNMSDPSYMDYVLDTSVHVRFWSWGSRFWKTGKWNDAQGYNGQYWMTATVIGYSGWDYYLLVSPQESTGLIETNPSKPSELSEQTTPVRMNPLSPGIRASTMPLISIQNQLPSDPGVSLSPWHYNEW